MKFGAYEKVCRNKHAWSNDKKEAAAGYIEEGSTAKEKSRQVAARATPARGKFNIRRLLFAPFVYFSFVSFHDLHALSLCIHGLAPRSSKFNAHNCRHRKRRRGGDTKHERINKEYSRGSL